VVADRTRARHLVDGLRELDRALESIAGRLGHRLLDELLKPERKHGVARHAVREPKDRRGAMHAQQRQRVLGLERPLAAHHLEQHHTDCVDVGARVDQAAADRLLRRHVVGGPDDDVALRRVATDRAAQPCEAEIQDADVVAGPDLLADHDVGRLDVAMNDALRVGVRQPRRDLADQRERAPGRNRAVVDQRAQRRARDVLHHQVGSAVPHTEVDDRDAVGMGQLAHHPGLALEPREELRVVRKWRMEELDRDELSDGNALGLVDHPHGARRHPLEDAIAVVDELTDPRIARDARVIHHAAS
jgi:hypothetical protein